MFSLIRPGPGDVDVDVFAQQFVTFLRRKIEENHSNLQQHRTSVYKKGLGL